MKELGSQIENPFFALESMKGAKELIEATKKIAKAVNKLLPDLHLLHYTEPQVTIVGGFVRDALSGGQPKDADVEIFGVTQDELVKILENLFGKNNVNKVGKSFGVIKVSLGKGLGLDVSIPRVDSRGDGEKHKDIKAKDDPSLSIKEAQRRRDFTINALSMDVLSGAVMDSFGGVDDLKNKVLRLVDEETFKDDPLRVLRGVQFVARFGLTVEPKTFSFMKEMVTRGALDRLPAERILGEMEKLLTKSQHPSIGLELMRELGIIERHFPELNALIGCEQDQKHHPEGDVWVHTKLAVDKAAQLFDKRFPKPEKKSKEEYDEIRLVVMLGTLFHDIGKPPTTKRGEDGRIHSFGHETAGQSPAEAILKRLNVSNNVRDGVLRIIALHLYPNHQYKEFLKGKMNDKQYKKAVKKWFDKLIINKDKSFPWQAFLVTCEADYFSSGLQDKKPPFGPLKEITEIVGQEENFDKPVIRGFDILALWQEIKESERSGDSWVGEIIRVVKEEGIYDQKEALDRARELIEKL